MTQKRKHTKSREPRPKSWVKKVTKKKKHRNQPGGEVNVMGCHHCHDEKKLFVIRREPNRLVKSIACKACGK